MKKLLIGLSFLLSVGVLAGEMEDKLEKDLEMKYPVITDGTTSIKVDEYDVDLKHKKIKLEIELEDKDAKEMFDKLEKAKVEALAAEMAKYLQEETKTKLPVEVEIEVDREFLPDEKLFEKTFDR